jgi:signal transduction histidine kinase
MKHRSPKRVAVGQFGIFPRIVFAAGGRGGLMKHVATAALLVAPLFQSPASAQSLDFAVAQGFDSSLASLVFTSGLSLFIVALSLAFIQERRAWRNSGRGLTQALDEARARLDRARAFLESEEQLLVSWAGVDSDVEINIASLRLPHDLSPPEALDFNIWLEPDDAASLTVAIDKLRSKGERFRVVLAGRTEGRHFEAEGCAVGFSAVLRIREVSGDRLDLIAAKERCATLVSERDSLAALLDAAPTPVWIADPTGRLIFVNNAYVAAVEAQTSTEAIGKSLPLLDQTAREAAAAAIARGGVWRARAPAIVAGKRHLLDVTQLAVPQGEGAIAIDREEIETLREDLQQQMQSHKRVLDQLPTAIAIFDRSRQLVYRNEAYARLWQIDAGFLDQKPTDDEILDRLRAGRQVPAEVDFRAGRARILEAYRSTEPVRQTWHLPDGRIIDVVAHPNTLGGVTYLYDDATQTYELETRFNALNRTQSETLETLREGVAVFGADGRLKFCNPAFIRLWRLDPGALEKNPRFDVLAGRGSALFRNTDTLETLRAFVTGFDEMREGFTRRIECNDGVVIDCTAQSLLDGASLLTFVDVTADVNAERVLSERNKALLAAERLRNDFIHHVSYELRSPLNNINGFVHLLNEQATGPLNQKQLEYLGYVSKSSAALLAIVDDILDLATIDDDAMALEITDVDVAATMRSAIEGVQDRLVENDIDVRIVAMDNVGSFRGDAKRVRQILFNLLSNAIGFSSAGQTVTLAAMRRGDEVVFKVTDRGRGIPPEIIERIFDRFESHTTGTRHRGVGLGLSIVRDFMELHGGKIFVDSAPGEGTTVTCVFPARPSDEKPVGQTSSDEASEAAVRAANGRSA